MKRDMEIVRRLLMAIEDHEGPELPEMPELEGISRELIGEHTRLLIEAGLVDAIDASTFDGIDYMQLRLTWHGHDFVVSVHDPEVWRKTKEGAKMVGSWSVSLLVELAKGYAKQKAAELGLPLG